MRILILFVLLGFALSLKSQCNLEVSAGEDKYLCPGEEVTLDGEIIGSFDGFIWTPEFNLSDPESLNPTTDVPGTYTLTAQYSTGINIIINHDFSQGASGFTSDYIHSTPAMLHTCPAGNQVFGPLGCEGTYDVLNDPQLGHSSFANCADQSGDGNMLVVNGSSTLNDNVWCQTVVVNPTSSYEFSAWVASVVAGSPAILQFRVNGVLLGSSFSPGAGVCNWTESTAQWDANGVSNATICVSNQNTASGGNDFALDNIQFKEVCFVSDEVEVIAVPLSFDFDFIEPITCKNNSSTLSISNANGLGTDYNGFWENSFGDILGSGPAPNYTLDVNDAGEYSFTYVFEKNGATCRLTEFIEVEDQRIDFEVDAFADGPLDCSPSTTFVYGDGDFTIGEFVFEWQTTDGHIIGDKNEQTACVGRAGQYLFIAVDTITGCADSALVEVISSADIPNVRIAPIDSLSCRNGEVRINADSSNTQPNTLIDWSTIGGNIIGSTNDLNILVDSSGLYTLVLTNPDNNCSDTMSVFIHADFTEPDVRLNATDTIDCSRRDIYINFSEQSNTSYTWSSMGTIIQDSVPITLNTDGSYTLIATHDLSGCKDTANIDVISLINDPSANLLGFNTLDCYTRSLRLELDGLSPAENLQITWSSPLGSIIGERESENILLDGSGWYYYTLLDTLSSCTSTDSVFIPIDTIKPSIMVGNSIVMACQDTSVLLSASSSTAGVNTTWYREDGSPIASNMWTVEVFSPGVYQIYIENPDNGCTQVAYQVVTPDQDLPILNLSIPDTLNCNNSTVTLQATINNLALNDVEWSWTNPSGNEVSTSDEIRVESGGIYRVTAINKNNDCSVTKEIKVIEDYLKPSINTALLDSANCYDLNSTIAIPDWNPNYAYDLRDRDTAIIELISDSIFNISDTGSFLVYVLNPRNGCNSIKMLEMDGDFNAPEVPELISDTINCLMDSVQVKTNNVIFNSNLEYSFTDDQGLVLIYDSTNLSTWVQEAGMVSLNILDPRNGCSSNANIEVIMDTQAPTITPETPLEINCNNETVNIEFDDQIVMNMDISWYDENFIIELGRGTNLEVESSGVYGYSIFNQKNGCSSSGLIEVNENTERPTEIILNIEPANCKNERGVIVIDTVLGGTAPYTYSVNNRNVSSNFELPVGQETISVIDANGCLLEKELEVIKLGGVAVNLSEEYTIELGDSLEIISQINQNLSDIDSILWSTGSTNIDCSFCDRITVAPTEDQFYTIKVEDHYGCVSSDRTLVKVIFDPKIYVPNSFSPNVDGKNDRFVIFSSSRHLIGFKNLQIYNRWGDRLFYLNQFDANEYDSAWDGSYQGQDLNPAVFVYSFEAVFKNGLIKIYTGDISLIR